MKKYSALAMCGLALAAASGLWGLSASLAQEASKASNTPPAKEKKDRMIIRGGGAGWGDAQSKVNNPYGPVVATLKLDGGADRMQAIREAAAALSEAESDDAREDAERTLNELLNEYFEEDMNRREQELADVEARVKKLRELMERRREKKQEIIELQVEVLRNEADGLGFFSGEGPRGPLNSFFRFHTDASGLPANHPVVPGAAAPPGPPPLPPTQPRTAR